jgi:RecA/RadA recombinase
MPTYTTVVWPKVISMAKIDINAIVDDVRKLYAKDTKSKQMITTGDTIRQIYSVEDGIPVPEGHPLKEMLGLPCVPYNKIVQFSGRPDTGKSTVCGQLMASAQKSDHVVILLDSEDKMDASRFDKHFGGDSKELILIKTNEILQGGEKVRKTIIAIKDRYPDAKILFVYDSVGGAQSRSHAERELDSEKHSQPGQDAKEQGQVMKMLVALINKYPDSIAVVLANQVYAKIGFMAHGNQESGGQKIEFHSSLIIQLNRVKTLTKVVKGKKVKYGIITKASVKKNHLAQGETSVHEQTFEITAKGASISNEAVEDESET